MTPEEENYGTNMRRSAFALGLVAASLQDFATEILTRAVRAGAIDAEAVETIRLECISNLKNSHSQGLGIEEEAGVFRKALEDYEKYLETIISDGFAPSGEDDAEAPKS